MSLAPTVYRLKPGKTIEEFLKHTVFIPHPIDADYRFQLHHTPAERYALFGYWNENRQHFYTYGLSAGRASRPSPVPLCSNVVTYNIEPTILNYDGAGSATRHSGCWEGGVYQTNNRTPDSTEFNTVVAHHDLLSRTEFLKFWEPNTKLDPATPIPYYSPQTKHKYGYASNDLSNLRNPNYKRRLLKKPLLF